MSNDNTIDVRFGEILDDFLGRRRRGEPVTEAELLAAHPDLAGELRDALALVGELRAPRDGVAELLARGTLAPSADPRYLAEIGHYLITGFVGRGGMGVVLAALEPALNRTVALKLLRPELADDQTALARFSLEAKSAGGLRHANIVTVYAVGEHHGTPYLAMEYVDGPVLSRVLREWGPLPADVAREVTRQLLAGLSAAHAAGLIHRDIKPSNILLDGAGGLVPRPVKSTAFGGGMGEHCLPVDPPESARANEFAHATRALTRNSACSIETARDNPGALTVKIADFGLARMAEAHTRYTMPDSQLGTPEYMSPEQARGDEGIDHRTDLYSLGVVLFEMLTGRTPFRGGSPSAVIHRILHDEPPNVRSLRKGADEQLAGLAMRLMAKRPEDRFVSAGEALAALESNGRVALPHRRRRLVARSLRAVFACSALLLAAWIGAGVIGGSDKPSGSQAEARRVVAVSPPRPEQRKDPRYNTCVWARFDNSEEDPCFLNLSEWSDRPLVADAEIVDVDGNATGDLIVIGLATSDESGSVIAFDMDRRFVWRVSLTPDPMIDWPDFKSEPRHWGCRAMAVGDLDGEPGPEIIVAARDPVEYSTRISIVNPRTRRIESTFWHTGDIVGVKIVAGFFDDGQAAIIAWGVNNKLDGFDESCPPGTVCIEDAPRTVHDMVSVVMVLDPRDVAGLGPPRTDRIAMAPAHLYHYAYLNVSSCARDKAERAVPAAAIAMIDSVAVYSDFIGMGAEPWFDLNFNAGTLAESSSRNVRGNLKIDRHFRFRDVNLRHADDPLPTKDDWRKAWRPVVQAGEWVVGPLPPSGD